MGQIMIQDKQMLYYHYINQIKFLKEFTYKQIFTPLRIYNVGINNNTRN